MTISLAVACFYGISNAQIFIFKRSSRTKQLAVADSKLANAIKDKLSIKCVNDSGVMELMRGIRGQLDGLLTTVGDDNLRAMRLGLSHSLSRYKLKFSADKVSAMCKRSRVVVVAVAVGIVKAAMMLWYDFFLAGRGAEAECRRRGASEH